MNGYVCMHKGKRIEVEAMTVYEAQRKASKIFKAKKPWEVIAMLAEKNGEQVTHTPVD